MSEPFLSVRGGSKRQAMARLMVVDPGLMRGAYDLFAADLTAQGEHPPGFAEWEDHWWEVARAPEGEKK